MNFPQCIAATAKSEGWWQKISSAFNHTLFEVNETPVNGLGLVNLLILLLGAWFLSKLLNYFTHAPGMPPGIAFRWPR